jgi:hypothetical protein
LLNIQDDAVLTAIFQAWTELGSISTNILRNGTFSELDPEPYKALAEGLPAIDQPSRILAGWFTWAGIVGCQLTNPPTSLGLELGPRDFPGAISQIVSTEPGKLYELTFRAAAGRNQDITLRAGLFTTTFNAGDAVKNGPHIRTNHFRATSKLTTVLFIGRGNEGYGPFIDDLSLRVLPKEE